MESLEASEMLKLTTAGDFCHNMSKEDRNKKHRELKKIAERHAKIETKSMDDLEGFLKGINNGR